MGFESRREAPGFERNSTVERRGCEAFNTFSMFTNQFIVQCSNTTLLIVLYVRKNNILVSKITLVTLLL